MIDQRPIPSLPPELTFASPVLPKPDRRGQIIALRAE